MPADVRICISPKADIVFLKDRNTNQNARCSGSAEYIFPLPEMREDQGLRESRVRGWGKWKEAEGDGAHLG